MSELQLTPSVLQGTLAVPQSKSLAHRVAIATALAGGNPSALKLEPSEDILATVDGLHRLQRKETTICCEESASTLRFLLPISLAIGRGASFVCRENLVKRPLTPYFPIFDRCSVSFGYEQRRKELSSNSGQNPIVYKKNDQVFRVNGRLLHGEYSIDGSVSSQFISGLLFALPLLKGNSTLRVIRPMESRPYVELTCQVLRRYGIHITETEKQVFQIRGNQRYQLPKEPIELEGDYSQAAFFLCANELGSSVSISNLSSQSMQGDRRIVEILTQMRACKASGKNFQLNGSQCPDLMPIVAVTAALQNGLHTEIRGAKRLRIKECDRIEALCQEMNGLGAMMIERQDGFIIQGKSHLPGGVLTWSHNDHRIAMCMAIASLGCQKPIILKNWECVTKSYPGFFRDFVKLGGIVDEWSLGK